MGTARFATIFAITLSVQIPAVAYAILIPGLAIHTGFGLLSGYVTYQLIKKLPAPVAESSLPASPTLPEHVLHQKEAE